MAQATLLTDELVRRLIGVGQVDVLVGVPTLNSVDTMPGALQAVHEGLSRHFGRARTAVIVADGGSQDGTLELAAAPGGNSHPSGVLRTRHQIAASYRGVPGRASAIRLVFMAADLLQAKVIAVVDPDGGALAPGSVGDLLQPVAAQAFDLVAPVRARHPLERLLVTQLLRPLMRAAYGRQFDEPLLTEFACSARFAASCLAEDAWDRSPAREGIEVWLAARALAQKGAVAQLFVEAAAPPPRARPGLQEVFVPLVGSLFAALDAHAAVWQGETVAERVPVIGPERQPPDGAPAAPSGLGESFARDVRDLRPVLEEILAPETFEALSSIAESADAGLRYPDDLWVATVYDGLAAFHDGAIDRTHVVQALMPLYVGRVASFVTAHADAPASAVAGALEALALEFERRKPYVIGRWSPAP